MARTVDPHPTGPGADDLREDVDDGLTDRELSELALAADPDVDVAADARPLDDVLGRSSDDVLLPEWYMARPAGGGLLRGWRRGVVWLVIAAFVTITAYGLCNTYGDLALPTP